MDLKRRVGLLLLEAWELDLLIMNRILNEEECVHEILKTRDIMVKHVVTAKPNISIKKAIEMLFKRHVGAIVVTDDTRKCIGIFTERDAIRVVAQNISLNTPLKEVMTRNVVTISEDATFEESRRLVISHGVRHLPVVNSERRLVGLVVVRQFLDEFFGMKS